MHNYGSWHSYWVVGMTFQLWRLEKKTISVLNKCPNASRVTVYLYISCNMHTVLRKLYSEMNLILMKFSLLDAPGIVILTTVHSMSKFCQNNAISVLMCYDFLWIYLVHLTIFFRLLYWHWGNRMIEVTLMKIGKIYPYSSITNREPCTYLLGIFYQ